MAKRMRASARMSRKPRRNTGCETDLGHGTPGNGEAETDLVVRLRRAVVNELAAVESVRERLKNEPQSPVAAERTARTLSKLTDTLQKLQRLQCAVPANGPAYDMPADIDEFRNQLARRIRAFVESRTGRGAVDGNIAPRLDPVR
jgi:hypothetical protein